MQTDATHVQSPNFNLIPLCETYVWRVSKTNEILFKTSSEFLFAEFRQNNTSSWKAAWSLTTKGVLSFYWISKLNYSFIVVQSWSLHSARVIQREGFFTSTSQSEFLCFYMFLLQIVAIVGKVVYYPDTSHLLHVGKCYNIYISF